MKITIESKHFTGTADNLKTAYALLDILNQPIECSDDHIADASKTISSDIPNDKYLTITADDITIGGESTTEYNGNAILNRDDCIKYVKEASKSFVKEHGVSLEELHVVQANNIAREPVPDAQGKYTWLRCVFNVNGERKLSRWVFRYTFASVGACGSYCAYDCGNSVRYDATFRSGVFGSLGD